MIIIKLNLKQKKQNYPIKLQYLQNKKFPEWLVKYKILKSKY